MSDIVDDLLQEVEQLEASTQDLNDNVEKVEQQKVILNDSDAPSSVDTNLLALEAAKTTQEAAKQSHLAAKSSIKLADQLKARNLELDDLSNNWRQATRNTLKEVNSAKNNFTLLMTTTLIINVVALSVIGYFFYATNQENQMARSEVLDIIQTENALFNKKMTIKMDQQASLTENLSADIRALNSSDQLSSKAKKAAATKEMKQIGDTHSDKMSEDLSAKQSGETNESTAELKAQYGELKSLVESILAAQKQMTVLGKTIDTAQDPTQLKKLNDLSWLVKKQTKSLKAIQNSLVNKKPGVSSATNRETSKTLDALKADLHVLNQQQKKIQGQLKALQDDFSKYTAKPKEKPPYSYKSN